jgi:hypothetical protein
MDKKDIIPSCLQLFQDDPQFRVSLKSAMPVKSHKAINAVQREGMFLSNGMMSQAGHAFIKQLNSALPVVELTLATHDGDEIAARAHNQLHRILIGIFGDFGEPRLFNVLEGCLRVRSWSSG